MARLVRRKCPCLRPKIEEEVRVLDYRHSSLTDVPGDVFIYERTLEELHADSNQIRDLPRELFYCHGLRKLSVSDNEITNIPPAVASLDHLEELDFSKNGIIDVPDNIKCCKYLRVIDASVNPLGKLPEGFTQLQNLTHLYLNDTFLDYLPGSFGRLVKLKILELRENHLKTLPKSFGRLSELERLDIGNNEFTELPDVVGTLTKLLELWCDNNQITSLTHTIGALKQLMFLDASRNQLESLPGEIEGCTCLADLHLSINQLQTLPEAIGNLSNLTTLKAEDNQLTSLPSSLGGLTSLSELNVSVNDLEELPTSIGLLRNLRTFYADENLLTFVPAELGSCSGITVLSLRSNKLTYIPDEIGRIPRLRVLNLSDNELSYLPFTIVKLKELQALWLTENQTRPLIPLQSEYEADTGRKILTCYLLPQGQLANNDGGDEDNDSFHASMWEEERLQRQQIHFSFGDDDEDEGRLVRCPTPYPKEMREKARHMRNLAMRQSMSDGCEAPSRSPQADQCRNTQQEISTGSGDGVMDARVGESRTGKPQSPSLHETHRLYRYDKEKQMRDKARMQHQHSLHSSGDDTGVADTFQSSRPGGRSSGGSDTEDGRVEGRRKSTPNLFSFEGQSSEGTPPKRMPSFTYEDLYHKQILHKHHQPHGRRTRRMRDYDSDTGCRSDRGSSCHRKHSVEGRDDMSVRSQPTMSRSHRHSHHRETGYASDLEAYAGRGRGAPSRDGVTPSPGAKPSPQSHTPFPAHGVSDSNAPCNPSTSLVSVTVHPRPQSCLTVPSSGSFRHPGSPPSPSQFSNGSFTDHSTPVTRQTVQGFSASTPSSSSETYPQAGAGVGAGLTNRDVQRELYTVLEERQRKIAAQDSRPSPTPSSSRSVSMGATPPPYKPTPPYRRPSDRASDQSDAGSVPSSPLDSTKGGNSFSNPEYTAVQFATKGLEQGADRPAPAEEYETLSVVRDRTDVQQCDGGRRHSASPQQSCQEGDRVAQYQGVRTAQHQDKREGSQTAQQQGYGEGHRTYQFQGYREQPRAGEGYRTAQHQNYEGPQAAEYRGYREGSQTAQHQNYEGPQAAEYRGYREGSQTAQHHNYEGPQAAEYRGYREGSQTAQHQSYEGPQAAEHRGYRKGSQTAQQQGYGEGPRTSQLPVYGDGFRADSDGSHTPLNDSRLSSQDSSVSHYTASARVSSSQNSSHDPSSHGALPYPGSHLDRSRDNLTPVSHLHSAARHSPQQFSVTPAYRPRLGSRDRVLDGSMNSASFTLQKPFEAYPNPYGEPLEVGDPLMSRYEDVAIFKSMQDPSQVSSSTDSGYGHGHTVYERIGDFAARQAGSPHSSNPPSYRTTPVRQNSSSQGTPSRETTPVREEAFFSLQAPEFSESSSQISRDVFRTVIQKSPGLGFSIAGGVGSQGVNPFRNGDTGIFVTKVQPGGPAACRIQPGDKILRVNHVDFGNIDHNTAVNVLKTSSSVDLLVERVQKINMV